MIQKGLAMEYARENKILHAVAGVETGQLEILTQVVLAFGGANG